MSVDIISAAQKYKMIKSGDRVLVAVSGGPDSIALLHALYSHRNSLGLSLHIAHLNHGIRGESSDIDEEFVRGLAKLLKLPVTVKRADIPELKQIYKAGEEETARIVRREFLQRTASEVNACKIALGHNADDRAETLLMNIIRGTGVEGLGSIKPVQGNIIRPLIDTSRAEIEEYIAEHSLPFRIDESNLDTAYTRNRIRHDLIPLLESEYNPQVKEALARLAKVAEDQTKLIDDLTASARSKISCKGRVDTGMFLNLPEALQYQIVRMEIAAIKGGLIDVEFEQVDRIISSIKEDADFVITLPPGDIYAVKEGKEFFLKRKEVIKSAEPFDYALSVPGALSVPEINIEVVSEILDSAEFKGDKKTVCIDAGAIIGNLRIRNIHPGDRIQPFGMAGTKKLQDIFVDKKIPRQERAKAAVVVDDEKIIWLVGVVVSEKCRITDKTDMIVRLSLIK